MLYPLQDKEEDPLLMNMISNKNQKTVSIRPAIEYRKDFRKDGALVPKYPIS